jgi:hypothetical protein
LDKTLSLLTEIADRAVEKEPDSVWPGIDTCLDAAEDMMDSFIPQNNKIGLKGSSGQYPVDYIFDALVGIKPEITLFFFVTVNTGFAGKMRKLISALENICTAQQVKEIFFVQNSGSAKTDGLLWETAFQNPEDAFGLTNEYASQSNLVKVNSASGEYHLENTFETSGYVSITGGWELKDGKWYSGGDNRKTMIVNDKKQPIIRGSSLRNITLSTLTIITEGKIPSQCDLIASIFKVNNVVHIVSAYSIEHLFIQNCLIVADEYEKNPAIARSVLGLADTEKLRFITIKEYKQEQGRFAPVP